MVIKNHHLKIKLTYNQTQTFGLYFWIYITKYIVLLFFLVDSFANQLWSVPMLWIDANGDRIEIEDSEKYILTDRDIEFRIERAEFGDIEFYLANPVDRDSVLDGLFNFYRVKYDDFSFQLLIDNWLYIGTENQFVIISDRFALMQSGYVTPESFLGLNYIHKKKFAIFDHKKRLKNHTKNPI